jgi:hypothetical protein
MAILGDIILIIDAGRSNIIDMSNNIISPTSNRRHKTTRLMPFCGSTICYLGPDAIK